MVEVFGIEFPHMIINILPKSTSDKNAQIKPFIRKGICQTSKQFWPGITNIGFVIEIDLAIRFAIRPTNVLVFHITYPYRRLSGRWAICRRYS